MTNNNITFSFGENWKDFITTVDEQDIENARGDIIDWLSVDNIENKKVIDIGCGSGLHSYCFYSFGPKELISVDVDSSSVSATNTMKELAENPENWHVFSGSVLDESFINKLGKFDLVYSWGVLHHTGSMWTAVENALSLVLPGGLFWISLYVKGPGYAKDLAKKQKYNNLGRIGKKLFILKRILKVIWKRIKRGQNPFKWNEKIERGMHKYHDIIDWYGGLPYEVASTEEVVSFMSKNKFELVRVKETKERACNVYLFRKNL